MRLSKLAFRMLVISIVLQTYPMWSEFVFQSNLFKNDSNSTDLAVLNNNIGDLRFSCTYGGLWCECYTNNRGGCSVGCSPGIYQTWHNQSGCPQRENFFLVGMELS